MLIKRKDNTNKNEIFHNFVLFLKNSLPQDDPQDIRFICFLLLDLDFEQAKRVIVAFKEKVQEANIDDDNRLDALSFIYKNQIQDRQNDDL